MKHILIALILLLGFAFGQGTIDTDTDSKCGEIINGIFYEVECFTPIRERVITFGDILDYAEECYADTMRLEKFGEEYLLMHENYGEVFTEKQLEDKGYYYKYRWITNTIIDEEHPMEFEYIFIGKPTFKGFTEWTRSKHANKR